MDDAAGLPREFLLRMQGLMEADEYEAFLSSYGRERSFSLRVNTLKCSPEAFWRLAESFAPCCRREPETYSSEEDMSAGLRRVLWEPCGFYYPEEFRPGRLPWHEAGMYYIQEASAMLPAVLCGARPGERVLDLCAAPGGKSTKLAADMRGEGLLVANEIHPGRAKILSANIERMGIRNAVVTCETPQRLASRFPLFFDRIAVDAPCSGEGMFRKEEEAAAQWSPENVALCADRQAEILEEAAAMLRPGGILVYSTCTFSPEENEGAVFRFLLAHSDFTVVPAREILGPDMEAWSLEGGRPEWIGDLSGGRSAEGDLSGGWSAEGDLFGDRVEAGDFSGGRAEEAPPFEEGRAGIADSLRGAVRLWPHRISGEGHFVAVLRKRGGTGADAIKSAAKRGGMESSRKKKGGKRAAGGKQDRMTEEALRLWEEFALENLQISVKKESLLLSGDTLWALPVPADAISLDGMRVLRAGLQLGSVAKGRFEPSHALAMALGAGEAARCVRLTGAEPAAGSGKSRARVGQTGRDGLTGAEPAAGSGKCHARAGETVIVGLDGAEPAWSWLRGESLPLEEDPEKGWCLVLIDGCSAGWGKSAGGMLKNHYPRGLRKGSWYRA